MQKQGKIQAKPWQNMALEKSKATFFHSEVRFLEGNENNDSDKG
jgi:hypothetical protein